MSLVTMLDAIVTAVRDEIPALHMVAPYDGQFGPADLDRFQADVPCVLVTCVGFGDAEDQGDDLVAPGQWAMSLITERTTGDDLDASRLKAVMALAETLSVLVRGSNSDGGAWADDSAGAPSKIRAANVHSVSLDERGLTMWLLTWEQDASLVTFDPDALADLLRADTEFSVVGTDDVDPTTTTITTIFEVP